MTLQGLLWSVVSSACLVVFVVQSHSEIEHGVLLKLCCANFDPTSM